MFLPAVGEADRVVVSHVFAEHYPVRVRLFDLDDRALEAPEVVWDDGRRRKATVVRTRGDTYPYEQQKCLITIEGEGIEKALFLSTAHFRTIDVTWMAGDLILLRIGIGRVAEVVAIYDTGKDSWVSRDSMLYMAADENKLPR